MKTAIGIAKHYNYYKKVGQAKTNSPIGKKWKFSFILSPSS
ncbi:hypothetical protein AB9N12_12630 [Bacteroides sp. AN502(2024)]